jgi:hypothetical protein
MACRLCRFPSAAQSQQAIVAYMGRGDAQATLARITGRAQVSDAEVARLADVQSPLGMRYPPMSEATRSGDCDPSALPGGSVLACGRVAVRCPSPHASPDQQDRHG